MSAPSQAARADIRTLIGKHEAAVRDYERALSFPGRDLGKFSDRIKRIEDEMIALFDASFANFGPSVAAPRREEPKTANERRWSGDTWCNFCGGEHAPMLCPTRLNKLPTDIACPKCHHDSVSETPGNFGVCTHCGWRGVVTSDAPESATPTEPPVWLIERGQAEGFDPPYWWANGPFIRDATHAKQFANREEAEDCIRALRLEPARATEHLFLSREVMPTAGHDRASVGTGEAVRAPASPSAPPHEHHCDPNLANHGRGVCVCKCGATMGFSDDFWTERPAVVGSATAEEPSDEDWTDSDLKRLATATGETVWTPVATSLARYALRLQQRLASAERDRDQWRDHAARQHDIATQEINLRHAADARIKELEGEREDMIGALTTHLGCQGEAMIPSRIENLLAAERRGADLTKALEDIAKREGPFKRDELEFARSVIENMGNIARAALSAPPQPK